MKSGRKCRKGQSGEHLAFAHSTDSLPNLLSIRGWLGRVGAVIAKAGMKEKAVDANLVDPSAIVMDGTKTMQAKSRSVSGNAEKSFPKSMHGWIRSKTGVPMELTRIGTTISSPNRAAGAHSASLQFPVHASVAIFRWIITMLAVANKSAAIGAEEVFYVIGVICRWSELKAFQDGWKQQQPILRGIL
jgi:hypothetical protein